MESWGSEQRMAEERTSQIIRQAERLKGDIASARQDIEARKKSLARRRADLDSARDGIDRRRDRRLEDVKTETRGSRTEWDQIAQDTAGHRRFLCSEAAKLYGLTRIPRKGTPTRYEYRIGKVEAINLVNLNCKFCPCLVGAHPPSPTHTHMFLCFFGGFFVSCLSLSCSRLLFVLHHDFFCVLLSQLTDSCCAN